MGTTAKFDEIKAHVALHEVVVCVCSWNALVPGTNWGMPAQDQRLRNRD